MPEQFDEAWEYYAPDAEIVEVMGGVSRPDFWSGAWQFSDRPPPPAPAEVFDGCPVCKRRFCSQYAEQVCCSRRCDVIRRTTDPAYFRWRDGRVSEGLAARVVRGRECVVCGGRFATPRPQQLHCSPRCNGRASDVGRKIRKLRYRRAKGEPVKATPDIAVGQDVRICAPADPHVHGCIATVEQLEEWGACVRVVRPGHKPRWRAFWSEMVVV